MQHPPSRSAVHEPSASGQQHGPIRPRRAIGLLAVWLLVAACASGVPTAQGPASEPGARPQPPALPELEGDRELVPDDVAQTVEEADEIADRAEPVLGIGEATPVPLDPAFRSGRLDNGLVYLVRSNDRPENRAELRLVVDAGSLQEEESQRGLAHFVEHMAFNGTENFEKQELVDYLEGIGMRFGPDLNAYTSFDETVYMLQLPTDDADILSTGLDILEEWSQAISFEGDEIDKERGVVIEEWRSRQGAGSRILDQQLPVTFHDSLYAERLPIGEVEVLRNAPHDELRRFYRDWYRPDLMAVVAVGDFDADAMEAAIRERFSDLENPEDAPEREVVPIPDHEETLVSIVADPEATSTRITVGWKRPGFDPIETVGQLRSDLVDDLYHTLMIQRLSELAQSADPPFQFAYAFDGSLGRSRSMYQLVATVRNAGVVRGLESVLLEAKRVRDHGFTEAELERGRIDFLRSVERAWEERENQESRSLAQDAVSYFLEGDPAPGIEFLREVYEELVPGITLDEVNARADQWMGGDSEGAAAEANRVILVSGPDSEEAALPSEEELLAVFAEIDDVATTPWVDRASDAPLVSDVPEPGSITAEEEIPEVGATHWTLSNGVEVFLKPTDFKADQILMSASSPGGTSLASDEEYFNAAQASGIVGQMGLGSFGPIELGKKLTGKAAGVNAYINELQEGLSGSASPRDLETLFQLVHLSFVEPHYDEEAFESLKARLAGFLENQKASPGYWFAKRRREELFGDHPRRQGFEAEDVPRLDARAALAFYEDRFADASDFTFYFVGAFTLDEMRPLVELWLASLPAAGREESWRDVGGHALPGARSFTVRRGLEPRAQVQVTYFGDAEWTQERSVVAAAVGEALRIRLREVLREDLGGVYGVGVSTGLSRWPTGRYSAGFGFTTDPERVDELLEATHAEIEAFREDGPPQEVVDKVKESWRRGRETQLEQNGYWLGVLQDYVENERPWEDFDRFEERLDLVTVESIRDFTRELFDPANYVEGRLVPEAGAAAGGDSSGEGSGDVAGETEGGGDPDRGFAREGAGAR